MKERNPQVLVITEHSQLDHPELQAGVKKGQPFGIYDAAQSVNEYPKLAVAPKDAATQDQHIGYNAICSKAPECNKPKAIDLQWFSFFGILQEIIVANNLFIGSSLLLCSFINWFQLTGRLAASS